MSYIITDIVDAGAGSWGRSPRGKWNTDGAALAAAHEYVDAHIDEGDYGQTPLRAVPVKVYIDIAEIDDEGDEIDSERHSYTATAGGDVDVSAAAAELYDRLCDSRYAEHIDRPQPRAPWCAYAMVGTAASSVPALLILHALPACLAWAHIAPESERSQ